MNTEWNLQEHLVDMESRIRADIKSVAAIAASAQLDADEIRVESALLTGRIKALEEKAGWIGAGIGASLMGLVGFVWHVIASVGR